MLGQGAVWQRGEATHAPAQSGGVHPHHSGARRHPGEQQGLARGGVPPCGHTVWELCAHGRLVWGGGPQSCAHTHRDVPPFLKGALGEATEPRGNLGSGSIYPLSLGATELHT